MGEIEEKIHHKMISLYRDTGMDADIILLDQDSYNQLKHEIRKYYTGNHKPASFSNGFKFKGMKVFVNLYATEEFIELIPFKQLKENNYV